MPKTKTILVVEDERELCSILYDDLSSRGYKVEIARNGQEGLELVQGVEPDLIICDRAMPVMSGYQLLERIRGGYPQYSTLPFIFLTALSDPRDRHSVDHLNPTAYLEKPVDLEKLAETVRKVLAA
ncbi:MAG: response regulator [Alphaproteobacteria bacterium]|jgi:CheY-like chemotaxis protein|nr:response regulator [Alphaproteobacteria bacterium]MBP9050094.1 response regulator [Alphaproteobacteria bacterium]MBP9867578.1 response regulator [Alphaproteobacteria bacterium]